MPPTAEEPLVALRLLLAEQRFAVLATSQEDGQPYTSLVAFAPTSGDTELVFSTLRATRKYQNLVANPRVAMLISNHENRSTDLRNAAAVTALGRVNEVEGGDRSALEEVLLARHSAMREFVRSPGCALLSVKVRSYYLVTRFQNVIELHVQDGTLRSMDPATR